MKNVSMFFLGLFLAAATSLVGCEGGGGKKGLDSKQIEGSWTVQKKVFINQGREIEDKKCGEDILTFRADMTFFRETCYKPSNGAWSTPRIGETEYILMNYTSGKDADFGDSCKVLSFEGDEMQVITRVPLQTGDHFDVRMDLKRRAPL